MTEQQQIEAGLAALEAQRGVLGDAVVELAAAPLRARLEALLAQQAAAQQHLKQVSVMFVDTVGSTAMSRRLEPEDVQAVMDGALARFTAVVQAHRGRVMQYTGDGLLAAFGADEAREDDAEQAVRAGLAILAEAKAVAAGVAAEHGIEGFDVRVGIDTGPVLLGGGVDAEGTIRGSTVNMAARMEQTAPPGTLRIHHDTYRHVRGLFRVAAQPPLAVKGGEAPLATYLVQGVLPRALRTATRGVEGVHTRLVARESEAERLQQLFAQMRDGRRFVAVTVVADAGLGKSRLLQEFEHWVLAQPQDVLLYQGRAEPQTQARPFGLLRDVLAQRLQIADDDDAETAKGKLVTQLQPLIADDGQAQAHLLGHLIGFDFSASPHVRGLGDDARQLRNRGFHAAAQLLRQSAERLQAPVVMLLDDVHWADDGSLDFANYLSQVNRDVPTLMVLATRATLFERRPDLQLLESTFERIELAPLDPRASRELAGVLLQRVEPVPAALRELLIGGAEGNPFYMEELLRMLIDEGAIDTAGERWQVVPAKLVSVHVPPTLAGVLQSRLDSLPARERLTLQQAAVVGMVCWDQAVAALDPDALQALPPLVPRGLLLAREHAAFEGLREFAFKHQLLHQVTYESVLRRQRREWHARVAAWLAQFSADRATEVLGLVAEHYERAGDAANARAYCVRAAEAAAARYANAEMLQFVERGLALAGDDDPDARWRLLVLRERHRAQQADREAHRADLDALAALAEALDDDARRALVAMRRSTAARQGGESVTAERLAVEAVKRARAAGDAGVLVKALNVLADALIVQGRYGDARRVAEEALDRATQGGDLYAQSLLGNTVGLIAMECGDLADAVARFEQALALAREAGNRDHESMQLSNLGSCYPRLGEYAKARRHLDDALQLARRTSQRATEALVLLNIASTAHLQGDDTGALAYANTAFEHAAATGQRDLEAFARLVAGHAELALGRHEAARAAYTASRDLLQELQLRPQQVLDPVSGLARVALAQGRIDEALGHAEALLAHTAGGGTFDGTEEPLLLPLTCYRVLSAAGDARAEAVLADAVAALQAQAARIGDARSRRSFVEEVPHHRELMDAWARRPAAPTAHGATA